MAHRILLTYDTEVDVIHVRFRDLNEGEVVARTEHVDEFRNVDYDAAGEPIGVEFLFASDGVDLAELPHAEEIREALRLIPVPA